MVGVSDPDDLILGVIEVFDYQRITARDMYDLVQFRRRPFDSAQVRALAVLKRWSVGDALEPERFFNILQSEQYNWGDLTRLLRPDRRPDPESLMADCLAGCAFLQELSPEEAALAQDPYRQHRELFERIADRLKSQLHDPAS